MPGRSSPLYLAALGLAALLTSSAHAGEEPTLFRPRTVDVTGGFEDGTLKLAARFRLEFPSEKWAKALIFEKAPSPARVSLPRNVTLLREGGRLFCLGRGPLKRKLSSKVELPDSIAFEIKAEHVGRSLKLIVPVPASAAKSFSFTLAPGRWRVESEPEVPLEVLHGAANVVRVYPGGLREVRLLFHPERAEPEPLMVSMRQRLSATVEPGFVRTEIALEGKVTSGELRALQVDLPSDVEILRIRGPQVKDWSAAAAGARQRATVDLLEPAKGKVEVFVLTEGKAAAGVLSVPSVGVDLPGGERLRTPGTVTVSAGERLRVEPVGVTGLTRLRSSTGRPKWRFDQPGYSLALRAARRVPKVVARMDLGATVYEDAVGLNAVLRFSTDEPGLLGLVAGLGRGVKVLRVAGSKVSRWSVDAGRLKVSFRGLEAGEHSLAVEAVRRVADPKRVELPSIAVEGARNEAGHIGFSVGGKLFVARASGDGLRQVEPRMLPSWMRRHSHAYVVEAPGSPLVLELAELVPKTTSTTVVLAEIRADRLRLGLSDHLDVKRAPVFFHRYLLGDDLDVLSVKGTNVSEFTQEGGGLSVELSEGLTGRGRVMVRAQRYRERAEGDLQVPLPARLGAEHSESFLVLRPEKGLEIAPELPEGGPLVEASAADLPKWAPRPAESDRVFRYSHDARRAAAGALRVAVSREGAEFSVESVALLDFEPSRYRARAELDYSVTRGGMDELTVSLPAEAADPRFECPNLKRAEPAPGGKKGEWRLLLHGRATGALKLVVTFQGPVPALPKAVVFGGARPVGATRHRGYVGFRSGKDLEVLEDLDRYAGLERILSWPAKHRGHADYRTVYSFERDGWQLAARVERHSRADVAQAVVTSCSIVSAVERDGSVVTELTCMVKNSGGKQFLGVTHPEGATLWGAYVDEKPVKTSEAPLGEGGGRHALVPVLSAKEMSTVKLVYESHVTSWAGGMDVELATPELDVDAGELTWEVRLPEGVTALPASGNLELESRPAGVAHVSLVALVWKALGGFWDVMGPGLAAAGSVGLILARLAMLAALLGIALWLLVKILVAIVQRVERSRLAPAAAIAIVAVLGVGLFAVVFLAATPGGSRMAKYAESIVVTTDLAKAREPAAGEEDTGEGVIGVGGRARSSRRDWHYREGKVRDIFRNTKEINGDDVVENPIFLHEEMEVTDHFETANEMDKSTARGQEDAVSDIPLGGTGVVGNIGVGGGGAGAYGHRTGGGRMRSPDAPPPAPRKPGEPSRAQLETHVVDVQGTVFQKKLPAVTTAPASGYNAPRPEERFSPYDRPQQQRLVDVTKRVEEKRKKREEEKSLFEFARKQAAKGRLDEAKKQFEKIVTEKSESEYAQQAQEALQAMKDMKSKVSEQQGQAEAGGAEPEEPQVEFIGDSRIEGKTLKLPKTSQRVIVSKEHAKEPAGPGDRAEGWGYKDPGTGLSPTGEETAGREAPAETYAGKKHETRGSELSVEEAGVPYSKRLAYPEHWEKILARGDKGAVGDGREPAWMKSIRAKLDRKVSFEFVDTPLSEAINFLQTLTHVNMIIDPRATRGGRDVPVNLKVSDMNLGLALEWILKLAELDYQLKDNAVFISQPQNLAGEVVLKVYDIHDFAAKPEDFPGPDLDLNAAGQPGKGVKDGRPTVQSVAEMIQSRVADDTWSAELGTSIEERGGQLVIMQRPGAHRQIAALLEQLRAGAGGPLAMAQREGRLARPRATQDYFSTASGGLAKGALPLPVSISEIEGSKYVYRRTRLGSATGELRIRCVTRGAVGLLDVILVAAAAAALYFVGRRSTTGGAAIAAVLTILSVLALNIAGGDAAASAGPLLAVGIVGILVFSFRKRFPSGSSAGAGN